MSLKELEKQFIGGRLIKSDYIDQMYKCHDLLFEYSQFIKDRDIQKIEITDDAVVMTSRETSLKIICNRYDQRIIPVEILNFGCYEKKDSDMIFRLVNDGDTVFDVGGNIGWYSIGLSKAKSNLIVYAFEPIPSTYESLVANARLNGQTNIKILNVGLGNEKTELSFFFYKECSGNASRVVMNTDKDNIEIKCQVDTLDNVFGESNLKKLDFIKCDVEGAELFVFKGGVETIKKHKPIVFTEMLRKMAAKFDYHPNDIINLFKELGFGCYYTVGDKLLELKTMTDETEETNFFFLHKEKHQDIIRDLVS